MNFFIIIFIVNFNRIKNSLRYKAEVRELFRQKIDILDSNFDHKSKI